MHGSNLCINDTDRYCIIITPKFFHNEEYSKEMRQLPTMTETNHMHIHTSYTHQMKLTNLLERETLLIATLANEASPMRVLGCNPLLCQVEENLLAMKHRKSKEKRNSGENFLNWQIFTFDTNHNIN